LAILLQFEEQYLAVSLFEGKKWFPQELHFVILE